VSTDPPAPAIPSKIPSELPPPAPVRGFVGPYEILIELASGGMAVVYLARAVDGRAATPLVAIKRPHRHLASDKNFLAMLLDEARLASAIQHENVVKVRELRFEEGEPAIIMDYVEGASLMELMKELTLAERAFDLKVALRIVIDALHGMHAAHELTDGTGKPLGIVHRDISPHNVLVGTDGRTRLTDFGIAQAADRFQSTRTQEVKGKLAYLAPERVDKRRICTRQSDVFSMAIVLWECLAGRRLFRGDEAVDTLQEVMHLPIPRLRQLGSDIPGPLDDVLARALSRDLDVRYATAAELADALEKAAGPAAVGEHSQVAEMLEAVHGTRLSERHEKVRLALDGDAATTETLFVSAGLAYRRPGGAQSTAARIAAIAPPAPFDRYVFGAGVARLRLLDDRTTRWAIFGSVAAGVVLGVVGTVALARGRPTSTVASSPATPAASSSSPVASVSPVPPDSPTTRRVVVHLPFLAVSALIDGVAHDIVPAADVLTLTVPDPSSTSHHLLATALDGSTAEDDLVEREGEARILPPAPGPRSSAPPLRRGAAPAASVRIGVVRNGFTKLP